MMGALFDGFETARRERDERIAEQHRQEDKVDRSLAELGRLLDTDRQFLDAHGVTHAISNRTFHVNHRRSPTIAVHYDPGHDQFRLVNMRDNATTTLATPEDCARKIGALLFNVVEQ